MKVRSYQVQQQFIDIITKCGDGGDFWETATAFWCNPEMFIFCLVWLQELAGHLWLLALRRLCPHHPQLPSSVEEHLRKQSLAKGRVSTCLKIWWKQPGTPCPCVDGFHNDRFQKVGAWPRPRIGPELVQQGRCFCLIYLMKLAAGAVMCKDWAGRIVIFFPNLSNKEPFMIAVWL